MNISTLIGISSGGHGDGVGDILFIGFGVGALGRFFLK
jgi:hypothetical protein